VVDRVRARVFSSWLGISVTVQAKEETSVIQMQSHDSSWPWASVAVGYIQVGLPKPFY
jgi:hypothetical protein